MSRFRTFLILFGSISSTLAPAALVHRIQYEVTAAELRAVADAMTAFEARLAHLPETELAVLADGIKRGDASVGIYYRCGRGEDPRKASCLVTLTEASSTRSASAFAPSGKWAHWVEVPVALESFRRNVTELEQRLPAADPRRPLLVSQFFGGSGDDTHVVCSSLAGSGVHCFLAHRE